MNIIIAAQCIGILGQTLFNNGFLISYLSNLGIPGYQILTLLAIFPLCGVLFTVPFAIFADRVGPKLIGNIGLWIIYPGVLLMLVAGSSIIVAETIAITGIIVFSLGSAAFTSVWFALLRPIVPGELRGRFFGQLRIAWQTSAIAFTALATVLLNRFVNAG